MALRGGQCKTNPGTTIVLEERGSRGKNTESSLRIFHGGTQPNTSHQRHNGSQGPFDQLAAAGSYGEVQRDAHKQIPSARQTRRQANTANLASANKQSKQGQRPPCRSQSQAARVTGSRLCGVRAQWNELSGFEIL